MTCVVNVRDYLWVERGWKVLERFMKIKKFKFIELNFGGKNFKFKKFFLKKRKNIEKN